MCSIIGRFATGIIGFGWLLVSGRSRVPSPPARITAFIAPCSLRCTGVATARGPRAGRLGRSGCTERRVVAEDESADREEPAADDQRRRGRCRSMASSQRNSGNANISASVPAFPTHCTSMRRAPGGREHSTTTLTTPRARARGRRPSGDAALMIRARRPAIEQDPVGDRVEDLAELAALVEAAGDVAVDPVGRAEHREQAAAASGSSSASSQRKTGTPARRSSEMRFGSVTIRDPTAASVAITRLWRQRSRPSDPGSDVAHRALRTRRRRPGSRRR